MRRSLIKIGQQAVLTYGKEYYREYGIPSAETYFVNPTGQRNVGHQAYRVTFYFDESKEVLGPGFAAKVYIWADTKQAFSITLGNTFGFGIPREGE